MVGRDNRGVCRNPTELHIVAVINGAQRMLEFITEISQAQGHTSIGNELFLESVIAWKVYVGSSKLLKFQTILNTKLQTAKRSLNDVIRAGRRESHERSFLSLRIKPIESDLPLTGSYTEKLVLEE